uniref:Uncharacterized protein n=1 Tax=Rhizophora mucronata TaxID=61149 RepID=A0A2P2NJL3_RHIMU
MSEDTGSIWTFLFWPGFNSPSASDAGKVEPSSVAIFHLTFLLCRKCKRKKGQYNIILNTM